MTGASLETRSHRGSLRAMEAYIGLGVLASVLGIGLGLFLLFRHLERRRSERVGHAAQALGFSFDVEKDELLRQLASLPLFSHGRRQRIRNVLTRRIEGGTAHVFDYRYTVGTGKSSSTLEQTVVAFLESGASRPAFQLRPENVFHKLLQAVGYQDIDFDSHPTFSKQYLLRGADEGGVRQLFQPHVLTFFEGRPGLSLEGERGDLILYRPGKKVAPDALGPLFEEAREVFQVLRS